MKKYEFDEQQKRQIDEQFIPLVEDVRQLLSGTKEHIEIYLSTLRTIFPNLKDKQWKLDANYIDDGHYLFYGFTDIFGVFYPLNQYHIAGVCNNSDGDVNSVYAVKTIFIDNYKNIRKRIIQGVNKHNKEKTKNEIKEKNENVKISKQVNEILGKKKFQAPLTEAKVHFQYPDSMNVHELEMREEAGRKVGRIDFGDMVVEIITSGDIVIANKNQDKPKQKLRKKN